MHRIVALVMLVLWSPITSHTLLEGLGWIHQEPIQTGSDHHDAADGICLPGLAHNHVQHQSIGYSSPLLGGPISAWLSEDSLSGFTLLPIINSSPPELQASWQFASRAALPPRAPSFAS
jgi:hypothetical protein